MADRSSGRVSLCRRASAYSTKPPSRRGRDCLGASRQIRSPDIHRRPQVARNRRPQVARSRRPQVARSRRPQVVRSRRLPGVRSRRLGTGCVAVGRRRCVAVGRRWRVAVGRRWRVAVGRRRCVAIGRRRYVAVAGRGRVVQVGWRPKAGGGGRLIAIGRGRRSIVSPVHIALSSCGRSGKWGHCQDKSEFGSNRLQHLAAPLVLRDEPYQRPAQAFAISGLLSIVWAAKP